MPGPVGSEEGIGLLQGRYPRHPHVDHQAVLQSPPEPLYTALSLGGEGLDGLDAQDLQGLAELGPSFPGSPQLLREGEL